MIKKNFLVAVNVEPQMFFGEWSAWNFDSCDGNEGQTRERRR